MMMDGALRFVGLIFTPAVWIYIGVGVVVNVVFVGGRQLRSPNCIFALIHNSDLQHYFLSGMSTRDSGNGHVVR